MNHSDNIVLKPGQQEAFAQMMDFVNSPDQRVFILVGYAGTGKTTLMKFLIAELAKQKRPYRLLASTGRAAKILSNITGGDDEATTIHSMVYAFNGLNQDLSNVDTSRVEISGQLYLTFEPSTVKPDESQDGMVYIVDEASMVADRTDTNITQAMFGSGRLLKELLDYDQRPGSKYLFVGDPCQLPPITETFSPALYPQYFQQAFAIQAGLAQLTEIVRQGEDNDIIRVSQHIRACFQAAPPDKTAYRGYNYRDYLPFSGCNNITLHPSITSLIQHYVDNIRQHGFNHSTLICRSNRSCLRHSLAIRSQLGIGGGPVVKGDLLMVVQNNICGLMNGDMVEVVSVADQPIPHAGLTMRKVEVRELFTKQKRLILMIEDTLTSPTVNLSQVQQQALFLNFINRMKKKGITQKDPQRFADALRFDPYLNALRCNYGYAITCHKAQGGEWEEVYVDLPDPFMFQPIKSTYQWIYTAMTRARQTLHLVNGCNIC
jgi:hypothetical protein